MIKKLKDSVYGYRVKINSICDHSEREDEEGGYWSASSTNTLNDLVEKTSEYPDITSKFDIPSGSNAIVVWVEWSSGDSFGSHYAGSSEAVGIFTDLTAAKELKQHIETKNWDKDPHLSFATSDGQEFHIGFAGWAGYFESIAAVHIDAVKVF